ncbi:lipoamide acyltransferase component of branched-chain alpha-keto acid dehydrogenase complex, mitochondrial [Lepeophtheirus salmonis]|uniref:lipoamide acyltransferase component of branched-chain alpha-keto acid dehydrogenase complex, mitochondrial n=1 Tax=Lepeophtheirus salmonis TaxID=72036 RepID=UPI001AE7861A|nr:lipoamide acyltransferase component of branched-chain alpha-keto acid dehydrogenase complex, mitochondrial-like [Lepeophtheirus salmonis]
MFKILRTDPRWSSIIFRSIRTSKSVESAHYLSRRIRKEVPVSGRQTRPVLRTLKTLAPLHGKTTIPFYLSDIGEGIKEVTIKEWFVKPGDVVKQFDEICEVTSDKASVTISSRYDGQIKKLYYEVDEIAQTGDPLVDIEADLDGEIEGEREIMDSQAESAVEPSFSSEERPTGKRLATPAVRRLAAENNVNLMDVEASGKAGRILKDDIFAFLERNSDISSSSVSPKTVPIATKVSDPPLTPLVPPRPVIPQKDEIKPMSPYVKAMIKTMTESLQIPHFVYSDEITVDKLTDIKNLLRKSALERGVKLSYMPFIIKAASLGLVQYPILNAVPDFKKEIISFRENHNIGIAMDTPNGLLVPNVKNVQALSILEIGAELNRLQDLGVKGKLSSNDLNGGTFTISNIGSIGGTYMKPVITPGQVIIGAIGAIKAVPKFDKDDKIVKASIMNISWSADHRIIDGATVARFSNSMKDMIDNPETMLMHLK